MKGKLRPIHVAWLIALTYVAVLWISAPSVGFTRDEGYYFKAAEEYSGWWGVLFSSRFFEAFGDAEIMKHFGYNREHPPLIKLSQGATYYLFSKWLGLVSPSQGFRIAGFLYGGLSILATFLLGRELLSERVALLGAALLASIPRYFFDAHLACFDVPITALWILSLWTFLRGLNAPVGQVRRRALIAGLVFGLALAAKLNALFLPFVFVALWLIAPPAPLEVGLERSPSGGVDVRLPAIPPVLVACALIGPLVFVAAWPYLWHDTFVRIGSYIGFHLNHEHYPISYFGQLLVAPPFPISFPWVMTFFTAPSPIVALGGLGLIVAIVRTFRRSLPDAVLVVSTLLPIVLISMPNTPIFGGVKHWFNAMPTLTLLAARAAFWGVDLVRARFGGGWAPAAIATGLALAPGFLGEAASHPNGIGYYNELAGGYRGGARLGMQRGFWGGLAGPLYEQLGDHLKRGNRVFFNRTNYDSYRMYRRESTIAQRATYANDAKGADVGISFEQAEHAEREGEIWSSMGPRPVAGVYQDEVTLIQLYEAGASRAPL